MPATQQMVKVYRADVQSPVAPVAQAPGTKGNNPCLRSLKVDVHSNLSDVSSDWSDLLKQPHISLHHSLEWCRNWSETHENKLVLIEGLISGACAFLLPLEVISTPIGKVARFIGSPFSNINTGVFSSAFEHEADAALLREVQTQIRSKLAGIVDLVVLSNIPPAWRGVQNPFMHLSTICNQNSSFQLPLLGSWEETLAQINAKRRRKKYRTSVKRLEAVGGYEYVVAASADDKHALLDLYFQQKAIRFKALGLPDAFRAAETKAFFHSLLQSSGTSSDTPLELHALRLKACGTVAAIAGISRKGDHVICQFSSIDETIAADASPGEFLFYLVIEAEQKAGTAIFDFGIGDQLYKRNWCPVETEQRDVLLPLSLKGQIAALATRAMVKTKSIIKNNRLAYAMIQKFRSAKTGDNVSQDE